MLNVTLNITSETQIPIKEISINFLLPNLSIKIMLNIVPTAFKPEVTKESASAVVLEAIPAN